MKQILIFFFSSILDSSYMSHCLRPSSLPLQASQHEHPPSPPSTPDPSIAIPLPWRDTSSDSHATTTSASPYVTVDAESSCVLLDTPVSKAGTPTFCPVDFLQQTENGKGETFLPDSVVTNPRGVLVYL